MICQVSAHMLETILPSLLAGTAPAPALCPLLPFLPEPAGFTSTIWFGFLLEARGVLEARTQDTIARM